MGFFRELTIGYQLLFIAILLASGGLAYGLWHHSIYKAGEVACEARYTAAAATQAASAQAQIATEKVKYDQINQDIQKGTGFARPVSPLAGSAIGRMPSPHHAVK